MGWLSTWSYQLILCIQLLFLHSLTHSKLCSHDQASVLIHFKQLLTYSDTLLYDACHDARNPPHQKLKNWKEDTDCCSWGGVTCDMDTGHVTGLDLTCEGLNGTIPSDTLLFLLPYLQVLRLRGNFLLIGAIPEFNSSNPLEVLDVSFTGFSGRLPNSIGNLKSMTELNLQGCNFIGSIPASLGNLTKLSSLDLSSNQLSGPIPSSLSGLSNLEYFDLSRNSLNGTIPSNTTLFLLPYLQVLRLSYNPHVIGAFPEFNLSNPLEVLDVSFTGFSGPLPNSIGNLKSMTELNLESCNFTGSIPASLSNLQSVTTLDLSYNRFVGAIPEIFVNLTQLSSLVLSGNQLSGPIPSSLSGLSNLYDLDLFSNNLSGNLETYLFAKLTNLSWLNLSSNNFSGNLEPYIFANLTKLSWLALANNSLSLSSTTKVNSSFEAPCNLRELYLSHNKIQGKIPKWMGNLGKDNSISLDLSHNFLTGGIEQLPWKNLEDLDLKVSEPAYVSESAGRLQYMGDAYYQNSIMVTMKGVDIQMEKILTIFTTMDLSNNKFGGRIPGAVMACDGAVASSNSRRGQAGVQ
ncbi:hypothetical protein JRO89_XS05G0265800 [Xanthoceras sorbifolium]|uniref:Leucine-rich repeat-containing N-terminal plant-type domain-containing protein n=1 Tax=Xanthoceras sorbifolium TaxID=99658 RepID=A0ABQ8I3I8_9ROSI|nr:hypothetical protein JRO89_XS05G0265800 [Xanthoceras sorbifolium]